ncbi:S8 family serine peptidase [Nocardioides panacis]|uniref:S8 family serine peptidase n=1 Tax=Nocardioides panacis TaxID=2849501 RepID=A0A975T341_9ACTN|nr:S8 family serine peptidase [Nocardioides panacis]
MARAVRRRPGADLAGGHPGERQPVVTVRSPRRATAAAALSVALVGVAAPAPAAPSVPVAAEGQQCEVGKTRYVAESSAALSSLSVPQSWALATGKGVTVAVVDSGVDAGNAHLGRAVLPGTSFVPGAPTDDLLGHGTGVAGIIAARYVRGSALIGVAPEAKILPVRVFQDEDSTGTQPVAYPPDTGRMAAGIAWAVRHGADVVNVSMSTRPSDAALPRLKAALDLAHRKDVVVVASGGEPGPGRPVRPGPLPRGWPGRDRGGRVERRGRGGQLVDPRAAERRVRAGLRGADRVPRQRRLHRRAGPRLHQLGDRLRQRTRRPAPRALPEGVRGPDRLPDHGLRRPAAALRAGRRAGLGRDPALLRAHHVDRPEPARPAAARCRRRSGAGRGDVAGDPAGRPQRPARPRPRAGPVVGPRRGRALRPRARGAPVAGWGQARASYDARPASPHPGRGLREGVSPPSPHAAGPAPPGPRGPPRRRPGPAGPGRP